MIKARIGTECTDTISERERKTKCGMQILSSRDLFAPLFRKTFIKLEGISDC